ncbi:Ebp2-domain-containing protein [Ascobolus immersus RN42]|uniref:Ebp2-domain-containing protein n=1 Tax=Ascobolus immersus RN42 TaxID=1160509 RepID=A0A3N4IFX1_ASCIM|nr:Ebp2-domain-containing protein [Ascobolus immersus RN42]
MVKPKLKTVLAAEKGVDFKQQRINKQRKLAEKKKAQKKQTSQEPEDDTDSEDPEVEDQDDVPPALVPADAEVKKSKKKAAATEEDKKEAEGEWEDEESEEEDEDEEDEEEEEDDDESDAASVALSDISELDADVIPHQTLTINNTAALTAALARIETPKGPFSLVQRLTGPCPNLPKDIHDDLARELSFYQQALAAAKTARDLLRKEKVPFTRPTDYFAEMVKSDEHMGQVKGRLLEIAANKKAAQDARKMRDAKKFGKKVQQEKLASREQEKKKMLERVESLKRKRGTDDVGAADGAEFDVALEEAISGKDSKHNPNAKRAKRDAKYGHGGKKKRAKSNTFESTSDMTGFSAKAMKAKGPTGVKKGGKKRLGKSKRAGGKK